MYNINEDVYRLLIEEPFFAALSRCIDKYPSPSVPTAAVKVDRFGFSLLYNPIFVEKLEDGHKTGILIHEYYHIILGHLTNRHKAKNKIDRIVWNFAQDLAINSLIPRDKLPNECLMPGEGMFSEYPIGESSEWYYNKITKEAQEHPDLFSFSEGPFHLEMEEGTDLDDITNERIRSIIENAIMEASVRGWGSIPKEIREQIAKFASNKIDWRKLLSMFVKASIKSDKYSSVRKINKRFKYIHAGKSVRRHAKIAVSVDQSGSVSDEMLSEFFGELDNLLYLASFTLVPFDSEVNKKDVVKYEKGGKVEHKRVRCGGTNFNAPTKYVDSCQEFDGHIILTDMGAEKPIVPKVKRMWITKRDCEAPWDNGELVVKI